MEGHDKLRVLLLSDLHVGAPMHGANQAVLLDDLQQDVRGQVELTGGIDLFLVAGDIAFGAAPGSPPIPKQYEMAAEFMRSLHAANGGQTPAVFCAGNHDVDRSQATTNLGLRTLVRHFRDNRPDFDEFVEQGARHTNWSEIVAPQSAFSDFVDQFAQDRSPYGTTRLILERGAVGIAWVNTALLSFENEEKGLLRLGLPTLEHTFSQIRDCNLKILISHHPSSWLKEDESAEVQRFIEDRFEIHFHGHEHEIVVSSAPAGHLKVSAGAGYQGGQWRNRYAILDLAKQSLTFREGSSDTGQTWRGAHHPSTDGDGRVEVTLPHFGVAASRSADASFAPATSSAAQSPLAVSSISFDSLPGVLLYLEQAFAFTLQRNEAVSGERTRVFWPVRQRNPTVIHTVQAFAAAALSRAGAEIHLWIDDLGNPEVKTPEPLIGSLKKWMGLAGATAKPHVHLFSSALLHAETSAPGWEAVRAWWATEESGLLEVLRVTKFVVGDEAPNLQKNPRRLMAPAMIWAALEICRAQTPQVLTLGGFDEKPLWQVWERSVSARGVSHLFVPELRTGSKAALHMAGSSISWNSRDDVLNFIQSARVADAPSPALSWLERYVCLFLKSIIQGSTVRPHFSQWEDRQVDVLVNRLSSIVLDRRAPDTL